LALNFAVTTGGVNGGCTFDRSHPVAVRFDWQPDTSYQVSFGVRATNDHISVSPQIWLQDSAGRWVGVMNDVNQATQLAAPSSGQRDWVRHVSDITWTSGLSGQPSTGWLLFIPDIGGVPDREICAAAPFQAELAIDDVALRRIGPGAASPLLALGWPFADHSTGAPAWHRTEGSTWHKDDDVFAQDWNFATGSADLGESVFNVIEGTVVFAGSASNYGNNVVVLALDARYAVRYAHLQRIDVAPGDRVAVGTALGTVGATGLGKKGSPHLHISAYSDLSERMVASLRQGRIKCGSHASSCGQPFVLIP
jgi:hypothetical protein